MTKIMLVEDDKSLREIYGVRLLAEGYDIVSAGDGEQALAMAIKERPQLIISDIMMPKISGFDLLDILRSTTETRNTKVIMMTALSSEDQRMRGEQLGADKYLVKSQVGIEDVVRVVHEVLGDGAQAAASAAPPQQNQPAPNTPPAPSPAQQNPAAPTTTPQKSTSTSPEPAQNRSRIIEPLNNPHEQKIDMKELLDKELAHEAGYADNARPAVETTEQERSSVNEQIASFNPPSIQEEEAAVESILHHEATAEPTTNPSGAQAQPAAAPSTAPGTPPRPLQRPDAPQPMSSPQPATPPQQPAAQPVATSPAQAPTPTIAPQNQTSPTTLPTPTDFSANPSKTQSR